MATRYQQLRRAIANLAAPADRQAAYLDELHGNFGEAWGYGNDELALEFGDIYCACEDMLAHGEVTPAQAEAPRQLYDLLRKWSGAHNADFWPREALSSNPRWEDARALAQEALKAFPPR